MKSSSWSLTKTQKLLEYVRTQTMFCDQLGTPIDESTLFYILDEDTEKFRLGQIQWTDNISVEDRDVLCVELRINYLDSNDCETIDIPLRDLKNIRKQKENKENNEPGWLILESALVIPQNNQQFELLKNNYLEKIMMQRLTQDAPDDK